VSFTKWLILPMLILFSSDSCRAASAPIYPNSTNNPAVCAHRGWLGTDELENSIPRMKKTAAAGVTWIEMDLATSKDGTLYMLHDRTLDRTTTAKGPINHYTDAELATVYLRIGDTISNERIPSFAQFLEWLRTNNVHVLVDLKSGSPANAATMLRLAGLLQRVIFLSFDPDTDAKALAADPNVIVSLLVKSNDDVDSVIARANGHPIALYVPQGSTPELFQYAAKTGKPIISDAMDRLDVQAEQNGPATYREYLNTRPVAILVTNRAIQVQEALRR